MNYTPYSDTQLKGYTTMSAHSISRFIRKVENKVVDKIEDAQAFIGGVADTVSILKESYVELKDARKAELSSNK